MTSASATFWDRMAPRYAKSPIRDQANYERTLERTRTYLSRDDRVLELGCGTGTTALKLAPHTGDYIASDYSAGMTTIAAAKQREAGLSNLRVVTGAPGDAALTQLGPVDAVLAFNLFHLVPDLDATLAHVFATLRPGGLLISKTAALTEGPWFYRPLIAVMRTLRRIPFVGIFTGATLRRAMEHAGFETVEEDRHPAGSERVFLVMRKPEA